MATLYENIVALCERRGIKGGKMCTDIGISKGLLTDLKMGRRTGISAVTAQKIASYLRTDFSYISIIPISISKRYRLLTGNPTTL